MTKFDMSKYAPYRSLEEYIELRPSYFFESKTAEMVIVEEIKKSFDNSTGSTLAECGSGPGPLWNLIPSTIDILAVEPNRALWNLEHPKNVTYVEKGGFEFLSEHAKKIDVITWMWAMNYPLLSYFEKYDSDTKTVEMRDWLSGHSECLNNFVRVLQKQPSASWVVLFFDGESVEQSFVTSIWGETAPFPFNDRSHTRKLAEMAFNFHAFKTRAKLNVHHLTGVAEYGELDIAVERMMKFHLRGNFDSNSEVREKVRTFLSQYLDMGSVRCPAGAYLYTLTPSTCVN